MYAAVYAEFKNENVVCVIIIKSIFVSISGNLNVQKLVGKK